MKKDKNRVLLLGGAGFIGSNVASHFLECGWEVTIIDGFLLRTGGKSSNISHFENQITLINNDIGCVSNLSKLIYQSNVIVDAMGWTSHRLALNDPVYDLKLNLESHLHFMNAIPSDYDGRIIYLGTRSQYGSPACDFISEDTPMVPEDVQGIHKTAAEHHLKIGTKFKQYDVISLRFPNCFGENQPKAGEDIGLIGSFIRDALKDKTIDVFGDTRKRNILYVKDLARAIMMVATINQTKGFHAYNVVGNRISILELAQNICQKAGRGSVINKQLPDEIKAIDIGDAPFCGDLFQNEIGKLDQTEIAKAIENTMNYFKDEKHDLEM